MPKFLDVPTWYDNSGSLIQGVGVSSIPAVPAALCALNSKPQYIMASSSDNRQYLVYNPSGSNKMEWLTLPSYICDFQTDLIKNNTSFSDVAENYPFVFLCSVQQSSNAAFYNPFTLEKTGGYSDTFQCYFAFFMSGNNSISGSAVAYTVFAQTTESSHNGFVSFQTSKSDIMIECDTTYPVYCAKIGMKENH